MTNEFPFRQVHLDFHTSEAIPEIGAQFSKKQFQDMLKLGHVNSITIFSKCHHGYAYHPSKANEMNPGLKFDLLKEMLDACHEIGVNAPVYISAGLDEKMARRHPEWLLRRKDESTSWIKDFAQPGYHLFCMNTPYLDYLVAQVEELVANYDADGIFLDIVAVNPCYCQKCVGTLRSEGKDPYDKAAVLELAERVYANYTNRINTAIHNIKPDLRVFHNGGHIRCGRRDLAQMNTHLELESLPTGGWGYDHFPLSARYAQTLGMDFLGMTGKFHTTWGEFGGYKHPNALRYEAALSIANGARCSIGDQLHPAGFMDEATYRLIGAAYSEVEEKEDWCKNTINIADVALLSTEAVGIDDWLEGESERTGKSDAGAVRMLLEGKILFNIIDLEHDLSSYKVVILPDYIRISDSLKQKLSEYVKQGGKLLATGQSGLNVEGNSFALDFGIKWLSKNQYKPDYFRPNFELKNIGGAAFVQYSQGQRIELDGATELGKREDPYFNRDTFTFCSHQHTPSSLKSGGPGMTENETGIYIAWNVFEDYAKMGSLALKETLLYAIDKLLGAQKSLCTNLPAQGITTLTQQMSEKRLVNHLIYASPVKRGESISIIEDILPIYDVEVNIKTNEKVKRVYLAPQMQDILYTQEEGVLTYKVPKLECHQMVVMDY